MEVRWAETTLANHYTKHPLGNPDGRERECWGDLLSTSPPVSRRAYEESSYDVVEKPRLHFRLKRDPDDEFADHFLDERLVVCVTHDHRGRRQLRIRTCYHKHFGASSRHVPGEHRRGTSQQRLRRYLDWFEKMADANRWEWDFYVQDLVP